jgi:hypothetical protein
MDLPGDVRRQLAGNTLHSRSPEGNMHHFNHAFFISFQKEGVDFKSEKPSNGLGLRSSARSQTSGGYRDLRSKSSAVVHSVQIRQNAAKLWDPNIMMGIGW